ncbi:MAG: DegQ family serine endoprotease [Phycisphaerae bacterium]
MHSRRSWIIGAFMGVAAIGLGAAFPDLVSRAAYAVDRGKATASRERLAGVQDLSTAFEEVAKVIDPSVVNISSVKRIGATQKMQRLPDPFFNGPFRDFFGNGFFDRFFHQGGRQRGFVQQGLGTGVLVTEDGYVLTNDHVVAGADEVTVKLSDDRTFSAKVIGTDPKTDLAVVKIEATDLYPATLGNSDEVRIGQWVVAVGNPFGLSHTLTAGIVSAKGRSNVGIVDYEDFIQTDAAINPGNSGGPLVNLQGEVVGINTAIFSKSGGYMGIGFSIPINMAKSVLHSLIQDGKVVRGWLGVGIQDLNEGLAKSFDYDGKDGVLVGDVTPDSPADKAGFKSGDIITWYDGKKVPNMERLRSRVAQTKPGKDVAVKVFRDGQYKSLTVQIGELESEQLASAGKATAVGELGMTLRTLTPEIGQQLGYEDDVEGVVVTSVEPLSAADRAGIRARDVIVSVQDHEVKNVRDFGKVLKKYDLTEGVRLGVRTGSMRRFVFLRTVK